MRIIAGKFRGRALLAPKGEAIRPSSDRLRETLFNILSHRFQDEIEDALVLDLFAGTGALAFEALSRGARFACLVDDGTEARGLLRGNIEALGLGGITRVLKRDATKLGPVSPFQPFTLVFMDPPYGKGLCEQALHAGLDGGWFAEGALLVLEDRSGVDITLPPQIEMIDNRQAGEGQFTLARLNG